MTSRERLVAAARGGDVDQQPSVGWSGDVDALIVAPERVRETVASSGDQAVLADISNPFRTAQLQSLELSRALEEDPIAGNEVLEKVVQQVRGRIELALASGADGIFYRLHGAEPKNTSPMQYGGHYLERDRELLSEITDARFNLIYVVGGPEAYFDFVSDLPAHAFGWDQTALPVDEMRKMRSGALAGTGEGADIRIVSPQPNLTEYLENPTLAGV